MHTQIRRSVAVALCVAGSMLLGSCAPVATPGSPNDAAAAASSHEHITVYAAASLTQAFEHIITEFEHEHRSVSVEHLITDGSATLATQVIEGAPADVLATADEATMRAVTEAGLTREVTPFATNSLVVAVPKGNPASVTELADLARVVTVLCAPEVPCGEASHRLLDAAGVTVRAASVEQNVMSVLMKVSTNEADAGLVYATDVVGDDTVESFTPDGADSVINRYPITALTDSEHATAAQSFVDYVLSDAGQRILAHYGFGEAG